MIPPVCIPDVHDVHAIGIDKNLRIILERLQTQCSRGKKSCCTYFWIWILLVPCVRFFSNFSFLFVCHGTVYMEASAAGELTLRSDSESSCVRIFFGKLVPQRNPVAVAHATSREACSLKVDTKMLVCCLQWQQATITSNVSNAILSFAEEDMLVVHVVLNPVNLGYFTFNLPVHYTSEDDP